MNGPNVRYWPLADMHTSAYDPEQTLLLYVAMSTIFLKRTRCYFQNYSISEEAP
jgi:hypothetical protein